MTLASACKFAQAPRPDLILLDLHLPGLDGRDLLAEIKADSNLQNMAVVILTASQDHEDLLRSQLLNVDSYLTKPVDMEDFLKIIHKLRRYWHTDVILPNEI